MRYLIKLKPLEPYIFGTEQGFDYPGERGTGKESYFVKSAEIPEQTTLLGMIRFALLSHNKLLNTSFSYTAENREEMKKLIGPDSFSFLSEKEQDFGVIERLSPLFLLNEKGEILVKNPFHNVAKEEKQIENRSRKSGYVPMEMEDEEMLTEMGRIRLPKGSEFRAKEGYGTGYINLMDGEKTIETDLFQSVAVTGNRKNNKMADEKDSFFKQEMIALKQGYSFAFLLDLKEDVILPESVVYMGKKKSAFAFRAEKRDDIDLAVLLQKTFLGKDKWYYAFSDIYPGKSMQPSSFCIVEKKYQRNLETGYQENGKMNLKKGNIRFELIKSGSVFFENYPDILENANCKKIGYNQIVELGGI